MNWRVVVTRAFAVGFAAVVAAYTWWVGTPGVITDNEFKLTLLVGAPCLIVTLCADWVGNGHPPVDTRRDTYTQSENRRVIRPPWR
jgi:hypothetical protein